MDVGGSRILSDLFRALAPKGHPSRVLLDFLHVNLEDFVNQAMKIVRKPSVRLV